MRSLPLALILVACGGAEPAPATPTQAPAAAEEAAAPAAPKPQANAAAGRRVEVTIRGEGYEPSFVTATAGEVLRLSFVRHDEANCGGEVVFPETGERYEIPVGTPVEVSVTAPASGELAFTCGMGMYKGAILVEG